MVCAVLWQSRPTTRPTADYARTRKAEKKQKTAPQVVWLSDGARGLWRLYDERLAAYAMGILDFYHAVQHLWKGAAAWLDGRTIQAHR
jgi:hypothetical protein